MITSPSQWLFVWASYGITALVIGLLVGWVYLDARRHKRTLADLEARGVRRRSGS